MRAERAVLAGPYGNVRLRADLAVLHLGAGSVSESGGAGRLQVAATSMTNVSLSPAAEWSTSFACNNTGYTATPRVVLGLTQFLTAPSPVATAGFTEAGGLAATPGGKMRVTSQVSRSWGDLRLGLAGC